MASRSELHSGPSAKSPELPHRRHPVRAFSNARGAAVFAVGDWTDLPRSLYSRRTRKAYRQWFHRFYLLRSVECHASRPRQNVRRQSPTGTIQFKVENRHKCSDNSTKCPEKPTLCRWMRLTSGCWRYCAKTLGGQWPSWRGPSKCPAPQSIRGWKNCRSKVPSKVTL